MGTVVTVGIVACALVVSLLWLGSAHRHRRVSPDDLARFCDVLLTRGPAGSLMFIELFRRRDPEFLQVQRVGSGSGTRLRLDFPLAPWSQRYEAPLREAVRAKGCSFERHADTDHGGAVTAFLLVDLGPGPDHAAAVLQHILDKVFGVDPTMPALSIHFRGVPGP